MRNRQERDWDRALGIQTTGREDETGLRNMPYEPTPYPVLQRLADSGFTYPNPSQSEFPREVRLNIASMDPYEWASMPYCENTDHLEYKVHPTRRGVFCRSKSEALLFEIYDSLLIPFHDDEVLSIGDQLISPDFIGVRRDGALIFHEHCGLLTDEYRARNDWKPGLYAVADIYPGVNLIYTYDSVSGSLNTELAEAIIRDIYWL